jgi:hypothetical protein
MFNNKNCKKCNKTIKKDFDFCPYCGKALDDKNNWGMLGKSDLSENIKQENPLGGGFLNNMIGNAMRMLEKEMKKSMKDTKQMQPKTNLQLYINGKKINIGQQNNIQEKKKGQEQEKRIISKYFSKENIKRFSNMSKEELITHVRRLSDKIIYEIEMKDVNSINNVSIVQLESSIEIKAIGKEKSYYKIIQINLPIIDYYFSDDKLILELESKN